MSDRGTVFTALHDAIDWQRGLVDAYSHIPNAPERKEALDQIKRYKAVLKRRYPTAPQEPGAWIDGLQAVPLHEIDETHKSGSR